MRQLLLGPAGAGKTRQVLETIQDYLARNHGQKLLVFLPTESLTSHFRALLLDHGKIKGFTGQFLFTFRSLSYFLVSRKNNFTLARPHQKILLLEEVLQKNCPPYFAGVKTHRGFHQALLKSFKEFKESSLDGAYLERLFNSFHDRWSGKSLERFSALTSIYKEYQKALEERGWGDGEDLLSQAARLIKENPDLLEEKELLIVDGFYSFTPQEKLILEILLSKIEHALITLTAPGQKGGIFEPIQQTLKFLAPYQLEKSFLEAPHRFAASSLRIIAEKFLADDSGQKSPSNAEGLQIWEAPDRHAEAEAVAREIMFLVQRQGFDWAEIGIILRQPASYLHLFKEVFTLLNIPWRYWGKEPLTAVPWVKSALELGNLLARGWERERVFRLLRSGYFDLELSQVDTWEQRAQQRPLENEPAWREFLAAAKNSLEGDKDVGEKNIIGRLMEHSLKFRGKGTGTDWAEKYRVLLEEFLVPGAVRTLSRQKQHLPLAGVEKFLAVLEEVGRLKSQEEITFFDFLSALSLAVTAAEIFSPDPRKHAVNLIGVHEARQWELPVVFVVGLVEGEFPAPGKEDLFIKDYQRKSLQERNELHLPLSPTWAEEEILFYFAATRAQQRLYLTYPKGGATGKEFLPSTFIEEIKTLFTPPAGEKLVTRLPPLWACPPPEKIYSAGDLSLFTLGRKDTAGEEGQMARWILTHDQQHPWPRIMALPQYRNSLTKVSPEGVRGNHHTFSVTELETFAQCPLAYFYRYILGLEPLTLTYSEDLEFSYWGILAHRILELYCRPELEDTGRGLARYAPTDIPSLLEKILFQEPKAGTTTYIFLREKEFLRRNLINFLEREKARSHRYHFHPKALEWSFGKNAEPLVIEPTIRLSGKIDRLDVSTKDPNQAMIVDYKYSRQKKNLKARIEAGQELQLPLYLLAAEQLLGYKPAGGMLYYLKISISQPESFEDMAAIGREGFWPPDFGAKKVSLLGEKQWQETMQQVKAQVRELVACLQKGDIRPTPEKAEYCGDKKCQFFELCPIREREPQRETGEENERD